MEAKTGLSIILDKQVRVTTIMGSVLTTSTLAEGGELQVTPGLAEVWEQIGETLKERAKVFVDAIGEEQSRNEDTSGEPESEYFWRVRNVEFLHEEAQVGIQWETQLNRGWKTMYLKVPYVSFFFVPRGDFLPQI